MSFMGRSEYDRGVHTFSPEGRIFQIEYAIEAIKLGSTCLGLTTKEGVVLVVEKRLNSTLIHPSSVKKAFIVDDHIGAAASGLICDALKIVDHSRAECAQHIFQYEEKMPVQSCVESASDLMLDFSRMNDSDRKNKMSRPFGCGLLFGGWDDEGPALFSVDPSGTFTKCQAKAIGSAQEGATNMLQEQFKPDLAMKDAKEMAMLILRQVMEEKLTDQNVEMLIIENNQSDKLPKSTLLTVEELKTLIDSLPAAAIPGI